MDIEYCSAMSCHILTFREAGEGEDLRTLLYELLVARENTETDNRPAWMTRERPLDPAKKVESDP